MTEGGVPKKAVVRGAGDWPGRARSVHGVFESWAGPEEDKGRPTMISVSKCDALMF